MVNSSCQNETQILYCKTRLSIAPLRENVIILQPIIPLVLQLLQSTKRESGLKKKKKIPSVSLKFLRITETALCKYFNPE